ncbi:MAG: DUF4129 domain-containing protein [Actinomycetia bacterium]|nr:DUF4129 domain-containing protein [Actinomycetes bacterium]
MTGRLPLLPTEVPVDVGRDEAAAAAARELAKGVYAEQRPPLWQRALTWVLDRLQELFDAAVQATPGGPWGLLVLVLVLAAVLVAIRWRAGAVQRAGRGAAPVFVGRPQFAAEHRAAADRAAAEGRYADAVRERFRAVVRRLEERGLLDERPGRTADEAAAEAGSVLPGCAADLRAGATLFDEVVYGRRPADAAADARLRALDTRVETARPDARVGR